MTSSKFFNSKMSDKEIKAQYRKLARQYHPDLNPNNPDATKIMQQVNAEYDYYMAQLERAPKVAFSTGETYTQTEENASRKDAVNTRIREIIWELSHLPEDITIELCGYWIYVWGNTKPHKDIFKKLGLIFGYKEGQPVWTFRGVPARAKNCKMDDIRGWYGSKIAENNRVESDENLLGA